MEAKTKSIAFRAWPDNTERLKFAEEVGLNVSKIINELLRAHLKPTIEKETRELKKRLSAPVP